MGHQVPSPRKTRLGCPVAIVKAGYGVLLPVRSRSGRSRLCYCTPAPVPLCGMAATAVGWSLAGKGEYCESSSVPAVAQLKAGDVVAEKVGGVKKMVGRGIDADGHRLRPSA